jgi:hypothetical protein
MKIKTCKSCRSDFVPVRPLQRVCSPACAIAILKAKQAQRAAKQQRQDKQRIKTKAKWLQEAQTEFNKFIRLRDKFEPCISCNRMHTGQYHAGHYRSVGAAPAELRFCEENVHKQCAPCNNHLSGNIVQYRINLVRKIGIERVEWLEGKHKPKNYTIDDIKAIKATYREKCRSINADL